MPSDRGKGKEEVAHNQMGCCSAAKKNEMLPLAATWMDLQILIRSKVRQKGNDKHHMISLLCRI